jgi:hypothetical protein
MIIRALDENQDWMFGQGRQSYRTGADAIRENIQTRLLSWLNDTFWDMGFGVDWRNLLGGKNPTAQTGILLQCRTMILGSFGVVRITDVQATLDSTRHLLVSFSVDTIYGRTVTGQVTAQ